MKKVRIRFDKTLELVCERIVPDYMIEESPVGFYKFKETPQVDEAIDVPKLMGLIPIHLQLHGKETTLVYSTVDILHDVEKGDWWDESTSAALPRMTEELKKAIRWLSKKQPKGAALSPHGIFHGGRFGRKGITISLTPKGHKGSPVVVFNTSYLPTKVVVSPRAGLYSRDKYIFSERDIKQLRKAVRDAGGKIVDSWNGHHCPTYSIQLSNSAKGAGKAVDVYRKHGSVISRARFEKCIKPKGWGT